MLVSHFMLDLQEAYQRTLIVLSSDDGLYALESISSATPACVPGLGGLAARINSLGFERTDID